MLIHELYYLILNSGIKQICILKAQLHYVGSNKNEICFGAGKISHLGSKLGNPLFSLH